MKSELCFTKDDTLAMKGIAILIMFFHHCFSGRGRYEGFAISFAPFSEEMILYLAAFAKVCVGIFVFLSAYGITISMRRDSRSSIGTNSISTMIIRRLWRVLTGFWPVYLLCIAGTLLLAPEGMEVYGGGAAGVTYAIIDAMGLSRLLGTPIFIQTWWYMSLAIMQIFMMPLLVKLYDKMGGVWLMIMSILLPLALRLEVTDVVRWAPIMILGIWCADKNIPAVLKSWEPVPDKKRLSSLVKLFIAAAFVCLSILGKNSEIGKEYMSFFDLISAASVLMFAVLFLVGIPGLRRVLIVLGTYSMNMFLIHSFIRDRWFHDFTYSFRYWWLILLVLLVDSLLVAVIIEAMKRVLRYQKFIAWGEKKMGMSK